MNNKKLMLQKLNFNISDDCVYLVRKNNDGKNIHFVIKSNELDEIIDSIQLFIDASESELGFIS